MTKARHLGIGHYGIGFKDGVNTVIARNVRALRQIDPSIKITLFGKLAPDYEEFLQPVPGALEYLNIDGFDPADESGRLRGKSIGEQQVHDYVWQGTNLAETLSEKLAPMDVVLVENLGIGLDPSVTYAFYLYTQYCFLSGDKKRFIYRFHDFAQQRPSNFANVKKFHDYRFGVVPNWHSVLFPSAPNIRYVSINRYDCTRLVEHGIEESSIFYVPNSVDPSIVPPDDRTADLRKRIIERDNLDPSVRFILYPVRCIRRKNVEEAVFFTCLLNSLAEGKTSRKDVPVKNRFHLLVSLRPTSGDDARYADQIVHFVQKHGLPVSIGLEDLVSLEREVDARNGSKINRYGVGDMYRVADLVITTSVLEGFGFAYLEPWVLDRAVIGRSIPFITPDFQAAGMRLGHLYTALIVDDRDFKDIGPGKLEPDKALQERLAAIPKLQDAGFVDKVIRRNETPMLGTLRLLDEENRKEVIAINKQVVEKAYSQERIGRQLYDVITSA